MASLFTSLSRTAIATIFSEAVLPTCQHQQPQALTATTAHFNNITSLQEGNLSHNMLLFSCHHWCTSHNLHASTTSIRCNSDLMKTPAFSYLASHSETLAQIYYARNQLLARNSTSNTQQQHQRCQHHIKGAPLLTEDLKGLTTHLALLLVADADALFATSTPLPGPFSSIFSALPFCNDCRQASLAWPFTL